MIFSFFLNIPAKRTLNLYAQKFIVFYESVNLYDFTRMGREEEMDSAIKTNHNGHLESSRIHNRDRDKENIPESPEVKLTPYERLSHDLGNDQKFLKEITLGKRIGFYRIRGELGTGNFSQVKMGIHSLTKGKFFSVLYNIYGFCMSY